MARIRSRHWGVTVEATIIEQKEKPTQPASKQWAPQNNNIVSHTHHFRKEGLRFPSKTTKLNSHIYLLAWATPLLGGGDGEKRRRGDMKKEEKMGILNEENYTRLIVETEEGKKVAEVTLTDATPADGYRIRLTPKYD